MKPLISICIPTYNRAECLKETIDSVVCQPEFLSGKAELIISDNASTDKTEEICKEYTTYHNFYYHKNKENVVDKNFPLVLSLAHGKLRKLNNDTFVMANDSLAILCDVAQKYDSSRPFIFLNNSYGKDTELNFHDFVIKTGYWITWIAGFTIWEDECKNILCDTSGCELKLWQTQKAYELAYTKNNAVICSKVFGKSIAPPKKDLSYGLFNIFYCNYMSILNTYVDNHSLKSSDIQYLEKQLLFEYFCSLLVSLHLNKANMKLASNEDLKTSVYDHYRNKPYWLKFKLIYKMKLLKAIVINKVIRRI